MTPAKLCAGTAIPKSLPSQKRRIFASLGSDGKSWAGSPRRPPQRWPHMNGMPEGRLAFGGREIPILRAGASSRASSAGLAGPGFPGGLLACPGTWAAPCPDRRTPGRRPLGPDRAPRPAAVGWAGPSDQAAPPWPACSRSPVAGSTPAPGATAPRGNPRTARCPGGAGPPPLPGPSGSLMAFRLLASRIPINATARSSSSRARLRCIRRDSINAYPPNRRISRHTVARRAGQAKPGRMRRETAADIKTSRARRVVLA